MKRSALVAAIFVAVNLMGMNTGFADTLHLKNGNAIEGTIEAADEQQVTIDVPGVGALTLERAEIASIEKSSPQQEVTPQTTPQGETHRGNSLSQASPQPKGATYSSPALGISLVKPANWSVTEVNRRVTLTKRQQPSDAPKTTIELGTKPLGNFDPSDVKAMTEAGLVGFRIAYQDFKVVQAPESVRLNGKTAGHAAGRYMDKCPRRTGGFMSVDTRMEMWVIPRARDVILVAAGAWQDDADTIGEIREIVNSLVVKDR